MTYSSDWTRPLHLSTKHFIDMYSCLPQLTTGSGGEDFRDDVLKLRCTAVFWLTGRKNSLLIYPFRPHYESHFNFFLTRKVLVVSPFFLFAVLPFSGKIWAAAPVVTATLDSETSGSVDAGPRLPADPPDMCIAHSNSTSLSSLPPPPPPCSKGELSLSSGSVQFSCC